MGTLDGLIVGPTETTIDGATTTALTAAQVAIDGVITADFAAFGLLMSDLFAAHSNAGSASMSGSHGTTQTVMSAGVNWQGQAAAASIRGQALARANETYNVSNAAQVQALCETASLSSGLGQAASATSSIVRGFSNGASTPPGTGGAPAASAAQLPANAATNVSNYNATNGIPQRVTQMATNVNLLFCSTATDGSACQNSTTNGTYLDTDVFQLSQILTFPDNDSQLTNAAYLQYANYILGQPPENPSQDQSFRSSAEGQMAVVAQREKIAYMNTASLAFAQHFANRQPSASGEGSIVSNMFSAVNSGTSANLSSPTAVNSGEVSLDALYAAMYKNMATDPQTYSALAGMNDSATLRFVAGLDLLGNYLEYQRYQVAQSNFEVTSARLALKTRETDFNRHP
jgi:hypothetical protein